MAQSQKFRLTLVPQWLCTTCLAKKLFLWNRNPNFRLRFRHLKVFGSGPSYPNLLGPRLHSPYCKTTNTCCTDLIFRNLFFFVNTSFYVFQMPVFLTFLNTRIYQGGIQSSSFPGNHQISTRSCFICRYFIEIYTDLYSIRLLQPKCRC